MSYIKKWLSQEEINALLLPYDLNETATSLASIEHRMNQTVTMDQLVMLCSCYEVDPKLQDNIKNHLTNPEPQSFKISMLIIINSEEIKIELVEVNKL